MTQRERNLVYVLGGILGVGAVALVGYQWFAAPLKSYNDDIDRLDQEVVRKETELNQLRADMLDLDKARKQSLHAKPDEAALEYSKYLKKVLADCGLKVEVFTPPSPVDLRSHAAKAGKEALHIKMPFIVRAQGTLPQLAKFLETVQRTPVLHRVKTMTLDRVDGKEATPRVNAQITLEAMISSGAYAKLEPTLKPDPKMKLNEGNSSRQYADLSKRNPFTGPLPPPPEKIAKKEEPEDDPEPEFDVRKYVRLVLTDPINDEAFLRYLIFRMPEVRIKSEPMTGYDTFRIIDEERKPVLRAKVLRIDQRDVYFQIGEDVYGIHIGQNLAEAMRRPLSDAEMREFELTSLYNAEEAKVKGGKDNTKGTTKGNNKGLTKGTGFGPKKKG